MVCIGLLLDQLLGEPKRFHPLVGFGNFANLLETKLNQNPDSTRSLTLGFLALIVLVVPLPLSEQLYWIFTVSIIYWAVGFKSLLAHSRKVAGNLSDSDLVNARHSISLMVSRDTNKMDETEITRATIESTLENGCDSTFGVLFWYLVGGAPMVVFYRLSNTLDAMWGYRTQRFELFGKSAAKLDDLLNYIPARLTALSYALCGNTHLAIKSWRAHAKTLASPNAGPVMSAGAGSLDVTLGGPASYHDAVLEKPFFGGKNQAKGSDILRANRLVTKALMLWCAAIGLLSLLIFIAG